MATPESGSFSNPTKNWKRPPIRVAIPSWKFCRHLRLHHLHNQQRKRKGCPARVEPPNQSSNASEEVVPPSASSSKPTKRRKRVPCESNNAFEEVVPESASGSGSGSSSKPRTWDVFINHRGPDTKKTLATFIYDTLKSMGLEIFLDQPELDLGDLIPSRIEEAMTSSFLHIAILSPRYAESPWCLAELSYMLNTGKTVIPVFYKVEPRDIRWTTKGKGVYTDAFSKHKEGARYSSEKLNDWKVALQDVTYRTGHIVEENDDEGEANLLEAIKDYIKDTQKIPLVVANYPLGLDEILQDFERNAFDSSKNINIVGIVGMGGCGKTTVAKEYYNKKINSIYKCCFIHKARDETKTNLHEKQKEMIQDLGFKNVQNVDNVEKRKAILAKHLRSVQMLIILDDVDHQEQLEALLPIQDSLGQGSVIVITSRESEVLTSWGVSSIYKMKELDPKYAMKLFCWHAFRQPSPINEFQLLVENFLEVCKGLPLSLKVLGGLVNGKPQDYWNAQLDKISRVLPKDIKDILEVSFDALDEEEKEIFLDICCFFIGEKEELAVTVWDGSASGWSGPHSLTVLKNKCLVEVDEKNCIKMHDHLRDMGREIANKGKEIVKSPLRLWSPEQIGDIEIEGQEGVLIRGIRGIRAVTEDFYKECMKLVENVRGSSKRFKQRLEILVARNNYFTKESAILSAGLVWLRWFNFPHTALPSWLPLNLRILELEPGDDLEELWSDTADPPEQLRELFICEVFSLLRFPSSIGRLQHLKKIVISVASAIEDLLADFCKLKSLEYLVLEHCEKLMSLPPKFGNLRNLRHLKLSFSGLMTLPPSFENLINLQNIYLIHCSELTLQADNFVNITKLEVIKVYGCKNLTNWPAQIPNQKSLKKLKVGSMSLMELPYNIGELSKLEKLTINKSPLKTLPPIRNLSSLTHLDICDVKLKSLNVLSRCSSSSLCSLKYIEVERTLVSRISISQQCCPSLEKVLLSYNDQLVEIDSLPISVKTIEVIDCEKLKSISGVCGLVNLEKLVLRYSGKELKEFPNVKELVSLREFEIKESADKELKIIEELEYCRSLETLIAHNWGRRSLESMESLRRIEVSAWKGISALQPCHQTIKRSKWPSECIVCAKIGSGVKAALESWEFPGVNLVELCKAAESKWGSVELRLKCGQKRSSNVAAMMCFVINFMSPNAKLWRYSSMRLMEMEAGKWVWIGVFTQSSPFGWEEEFALEKNGEKTFGEDDMGMLMTGEEEKVVEAFYQLLQYLGNHVIPV